MSFSIPFPSFGRSRVAQLAVVLGGFTGLLCSSSQAATFEVSNLNDSGAGSLREAISLANDSPGADTITFASDVTGTISLTGGEFPINSDLTINGPGRDTLTLTVTVYSGRFFNIAGGSTVSINDLTLNNGKVRASSGADFSDRAAQPEPSRVGGTGGEARGGAILNAGALTLTNVLLSDNEVIGGTGGIGGPEISSRYDTSLNRPPGVGGRGGAGRGGAIFNSGTLNVINSIFLNNSARGGIGGKGGSGYNSNRGGSGGQGGDASGGAIFNEGSLNITDITLTGNKAIGGAGGIGGGDYSLGPDGKNGTGSNDGIGSTGEIHTNVPLAENVTFTGTQGKGFSGQLVGLGSNLSYSIVSGNLPSGLALDPSTGFITGYPTEVANGRQVTFKVNNGLRDSNVATATFNIAAGIINPLVVTTTSDVTDASDGLTSLREAVTYANASPDAKTITFNFFGAGPHVVNLNRINPDGEAVGLDIRSNLMIKGLDASKIIIQSQRRGAFIRVDSNYMVYISGVTITGGSGSQHGGVYNQGKLNISNSIISGNGSDYYAGGIYNAGDLSLTNCLIRDNVGSSGGAGGIYNSGNLSLLNCTLSGNRSPSGGGIHNAGTMSASNCTITENSASQGGGIYNGLPDGAYGRSASAVLDSCTITGNISDGSFYTGGAGIYSYAYVESGPVSMQVTNCIIAGNQQEGGRQSDVDSYTSLSNNFVSGGYNLVGGGNNLSQGQFFTQPSDHTGVSASAIGLDPAGLKDNGGPVATIALLPDSMAVNAGSTDLTTDERGFPRPFGDADDIGAYELQQNPTPSGTPSVGNFTLTLVEDRILNLSKPDFISAFTPASPGRDLTRIRITALPAHGTLKLGNIVATLNQEVDIDSLNTLTYTPTSNYYGTDSFGYMGADAFVYSTTSANVYFSISPVNDAPTVSALANQTIQQDATLGPLNFTVGDIDTPLDSLQISAVSSSTELVPSDNIVLGGSDANRTLTLTPGPGKVGSAFITLIVSDGTISTQTFFTLTVTEREDGPSITSIADQTTNEDTPTSALAFTVADAKTPANDLIVTAFSSNTALVPDSALVLGGSGSERTITITPAPNASGQTSVTLTVIDGDNLLNRTVFMLTVVPVNDAPVAQDKTLYGTVGQELAFTLGASDIEGDALSYEVVEYPGDGTAGGGQLKGSAPSLRFISFTPGTYTLRFRARDAAGATSNTATVTLVIRAPLGHSATGTVVSSQPNDSFSASVQVPLSNAQVQLEQKGQVVATTATDSTGRYTFYNLDSGTYTVRVVSIMPAGSGTASLLGFELSQALKIKVTKKTPAIAQWNVPTFTLYSVWGQVSAKSSDKKNKTLTLLPGATVQLSKSNSAKYPAFTRSATADINGFYVFSYLGRARFKLGAQSNGVSFPRNGVSVNLPGTKRQIAPSARVDITGTIGGNSKNNSAASSVNAS